MPFRYGESVKDQLFQLVHDICALERGVSMQAEQKTVQWQADRAIFAGHLALNPVFLKFLPHRRDGNFRVSHFILELDDGDTSLEMRHKDSASLDGDPFAIALLTQAHQIFASHNHEDCLAVAEADSQLAGTPLVTQRAKTGEVILQ